MKITGNTNHANDRKHYFLLLATVMFAIAAIGSFAYGLGPSEKGKVSEVTYWRYFKGPQKPPPKWNHFDFEDSTWLRGHGKFGYGHSGLDTHLNDMRSKYKRLFIRSEFAVTSQRTVSKMNLRVICDGPFIAYINGIEVIRNDYKTTELLDISGFVHELIPGKNILAIECYNDEINSESFYLYPTLEIHEK